MTPNEHAEDGGVEDASADFVFFMPFVAFLNLLSTPRSVAMVTT